MKTWVIISEEIYPVDTTEEIEAAAQAVAEAGLRSVPVYVGDPDSPDAYANGQRIFAALRTIAETA